VIGKGTLPLIERHFDHDKSRFVIIDLHEDGEIAKTTACASSSRHHHDNTARCWCRC
jgi:homospermidine synthase